MGEEEGRGGRAEEGGTTLSPSLLLPHPRLSGSPETMRSVSVRGHAICGVILCPRACWSSFPENPCGEMYSAGGAALSSPPSYLGGAGATRCRGLAWGEGCGEAGRQARDRQARNDRGRPVAHYTQNERKENEKHNE